MTNSNCVARLLNSSRSLLSRVPLDYEDHPYIHCKSKPDQGIFDPKRLVDWKKETGKKNKKGRKKKRRYKLELLERIMSPLIFYCISSYTPRALLKASAAAWPVCCCAACEAASQACTVASAALHLFCSCWHTKSLMTLMPPCGRRGRRQT
ncbi:hypothetical protein VTK73DRAFT_5697 [Phialemonium thermophilum]|uniref:Uncharacterized protein n=1 Tax=Phialemonium thermophilum TaxID=223376 RepID=A0ABR3V0Y2_9PEZI